MSTRISIIGSSNKKSIPLKYQIELARYIHSLHGKSIMINSEIGELKQYKK